MDNQGHTDRGKASTETPNPKGLVAGGNPGRAVGLERVKPNGTAGKSGLAEQEICIQLIQDLLSTKGVIRDELAVIISHVVATDTGVRLAHAIVTRNWTGIDMQSLHLMTKSARELSAAVLISYR